MGFLVFICSVFQGPEMFVMQARGMNRRGDRRHLQLPMLALSKNCTWRTMSRQG